MLKVVCVLAFIACTCAIPVEFVQENTVKAKWKSVEPEQSEHKSKSEKILSVKVGKCSFKEYMLNTMACERKFFLSFRENSTEPCKLRLNEYLMECMHESIDYCYEDEEKSLLAERVKEQLDKALPMYEKYFCGKDLYPMSEMLKSFNYSADSCKPGFLTLLDNCQKSFMEVYLKNRGNMSLCQKYDETMQCYNETITGMCSTDFFIKSKMNFIFTRKFNPFCDAKQINETMGSLDKGLHDFFHDHDMEHEHNGLHVKDGHDEHDEHDDHDDHDNHDDDHDDDHDHDHDDDHDHDHDDHSHDDDHHEDDMDVAMDFADY